MNIRRINLTLTSFILAFCTTAILTAQETPVSPSKQVKASTPALAKIQALQTEERAKETSVTFTIPTETLRTIAPEFVQTRTESVPSPHARMSHMAAEQKKTYTADYAAMVPLLVKAMQEQQTEIERLRNEISAMKAQAQK